MDEFQQLWPLMADHERSTDAYFELLALISKPDKASGIIGGESVTSLAGSTHSAHLTGATLEYLKCRLLQNMYPTVQVLRMLPAKLCVDVSWKAILHMTHILKRSPDSEVNMHLVNLLVHTVWPDEHIQLIEKLVFPVLIKCRPTEDPDKYWLCWLSSSTHQMLKCFIHFLSKNLNDLPSPETVFMLAVSKKQHFIDTLLNYEDILEEHMCISDDIKVTLCMIRLIDTLDQHAFNTNMLYNLIAFKANLNRIGLHRTIFLDLKRMCSLQSNLSIYVPKLNMTSFGKSFNVIDFMCKHLSLESIGYEQISAILNENQQFNADLSGLPLSDQFSSEVELYEQFTVLRMLRSVICGSTENNTLQMTQCKQSLQNINTLKGFIATIQAILTFIFLRWDHFNHVDLDRTIESGSESEMRPRYPSDDADSPVKMRTNNRFGFMCSVDNLSLILKTLRHALAKRRHSDQLLAATESERTEFESVAEVVTNATWRLSLLRSTNDKCLFSQPKVVDIKKYLREHQEDASQYKMKSSDDESDQNDIEQGGNVLPDVVAGDVRRVRRRKADRLSTTLPRRKPRKRVPFGKDDSERKLSFSHSTENERRQVSEVRRLVNTDDESDSLDPCVWIHNRRGAAFSRRCGMSKMLGNEEHLIALCMNKGDLRTTRNLIKVHGLHNSSLTHELEFTESFNQTKEKLRQILIRYRQQEEYSDVQTQPETSLNVSPNLSAFTSRLTVDRIKKVAGLGFETSKITNILAGFSTQNEVHISDPVETAATLKRFHDKHQFLAQYQPSGSLQATIVCDLVLSLAHNPDIALNMFSVLTKLWSPTPDGIDGGQTTSKIGYFRFLRNLVEALRVTVQFRGDVISTQRFLSNDFLTTNTTELISQLTREQMLTNLNRTQESEYNTMDKLHTFVANFKTLHRNSKEVFLFHRLVHFVSNASKLIQFGNAVPNVHSPNELLQLDLQATVGKMIFVSGVFPSDIEALTGGVNMNLVYAIAMNLSIPLERTIQNTDLNALEHMLGNMHNSNEEEETIEEVPSAMFDCQNAIVFDYVAKYSALLSYLLQKVLKGNDGADGVELAGCEHTLVENCLSVDAVRSLTTITDNNIWRAALSYDDITVEIVKHFLARTHDFENSLSAIQSVKCQHRIENHVAAHHLETWLIQHVLLGNAKNSEHNYLLIEHIFDINIRAKCLLDHILEINECPTVVRLIRSTLLHRNNKRLKPEYRKQLCVWLENINVYSNIALIFNANNISAEHTWLDVMRMSNDKPEKVLESLVRMQNFTLCLQWSAIHMARPGEGDTIPSISQIYADAVIRLTAMNGELFQLIEQLIAETVHNLYIQLIPSVRNVHVLRYIINYMNTGGYCLVHTYNLSLTLIECSDSGHPPPWHLMSTPLLIIEQYLMNSRFDALAKILNGVRRILGTESCAYCFEYSNRYICPGINYPSCDEASLLLHHEFSQHQEHCLSEDCVDSLLRIYATKALDFRVIESHSSSDDLLSHVTDQTMSSMDSLLGTFIMPREAPDRANWVRDDEATHCMCCRRAVFTMLTRRHHCRQCGRVVCHACSTHRALIPSLYSDVRVRICDDCNRQLEIDKTKLAAMAASSESTRSPSPHVNGSFSPERTIAVDDSTEWSFSGNIRHDELLREEFGYEFAPSVSLCLSILALHSNRGPDCANFLLLHCGKFESLLRPLQPGYPNPEIDYAMVTRMLNCLALAAKVRAAPPECDDILTNTEIIRDVVLHRCETLLPMEPLNESSFRKLRDALVLAEKWKLAIEISNKYGFSITGVMAAWGIACLKSGCFETAREKFQHCFKKVGTEDDIFKIITAMSYDDLQQINPAEELPHLKRPTKSPPLLAEILHILEVTNYSTQPNVIARARIIQNSNQSLTAPNRAKHYRSDDIPFHEPALNILHTLSNLKNIAAGIHDRPDNHTNNSSQTSTNRQPSTKSTSVSDISNRILTNPRFYDECLFYLASYGNHNNIVAFLVKYNQIRMALKYVYFQRVEAELFVRTLFMPYLRKGKAATVVQLMIELDETLLIWKPFIIPLCAHLERNGLLNCLYLLQILLKDPVRASMTCVRFYEKNCTTYLDLLGQSFHLANAEMHLTKELDLCQWEEIRVQTKPPRKTSTADGARTLQPQRTLLMKMDSKTLNGHINTINRQLEVTKFLAGCEQAGRPTVKLLPKMFMQSTSLPTLFGSTKDKLQVAILVLICGTNVTEGFGLAFRIIQDCNLEAELVYMSVAKYVANNQQLQRVEQLIDCIRGNSTSPTGPESRLCDRILGVAIDVFCSTGVSLNTDVMGRDSFERLVKQIGDVAIRINCHIAGGQLKSAYLLAVQHDRDADIRRVWRKAENTNQTHIRKLCERKLNLR